MPQAVRHIGGQFHPIKNRRLDRDRFFRGSEQKVGSIDTRFIGFARGSDEDVLRFGIDLHIQKEFFGGEIRFSIREAFVSQGGGRFASLGEGEARASGGKMLVRKFDIHRQLRPWPLECRGRSVVSRITRLGAESGWNVRKNFFHGLGAFKIIFPGELVGDFRDEPVSDGYAAAIGFHRGTSRSLLDLWCAIGIKSDADR